VFTGIVREVGAVEEPGPTLRVRAPETAARTGIGDSVSISGVCLTAVAIEDGAIRFDVVPETLRRSTLGSLTRGASVNVEPALHAGEPLGGHFVQGHVDGVGRIRARTDEGLEIEAPRALLRYCVEKGSIAVEGVSLTVSALRDDSFAVALVPHTLAATTLGGVAAGDKVNLEVDVLAKYVERLTIGAPLRSPHGESDA
jgi:riboflavin synthase